MAAVAEIVIGILKLLDMATERKKESPKAAPRKVVIFKKTGEEITSRQQLIEKLDSLGWMHVDSIDPHLIKYLKPFPFTSKTIYIPKDPKNVTRDHAREIVDKNPDAFEVRETN